MKKSDLKLSIVIPTLNRYPDLRNTLNCLYLQSFEAFEIIIIDQTDKPQKIDGDKIKYYHTPTKSASKARNLGLNVASNEIILFLDDDVVIDNIEFLSKHALHYLNPDTSGVSGAILDTSKKFESNLAKTAQDPNFGWFYFPLNYSKEASVANGGSGNLSVRRDWAIHVGGMDERFEKGAFREETDFCLRYTKEYGNLIYDPSAYLIHLGNPIGGSRTWENYNGVMHGKHHMFGGWYLMFRRLPVRFWLIYSYAMLRRFIIHKKLAIRPYLIPVAIFTFINAFLSALFFSIKEPLFIMKNPHPKNVAQKITIVIATYNRTRFLTETIESLLNQSYLPVEIIIVNDGSEEGFKKYLENIGEMSPLIKRIDLEENHGVSYARNIGVKYAKGNYVLFIDDDDILHPQMLEKCIQTFIKYPKVEIVMTGGEILNKNLNKFSHREKHVSLNSNRHLRLLHNESNSTLYFILFGMGLIHSLMFRKEVMIKHPFDEKLKTCEDTYQWMVLKSKGVIFRKIKLCGAFYRLHSDQISNKERIDKSKKDYLIKAFNIIDNDFDKIAFQIMNNRLLADTQVSTKKSNSYFFAKFPLTFIYLKIFMLENKVERNILFLNNLLVSVKNTHPNKRL